MRCESQRLFDLARKCFEDAADCDDAAQMKVLAEMARRYLEQAEAALAREKSSNGDRPSD